MVLTEQQEANIGWHLGGNVTLFNFTSPLWIPARRPQ